MLRKILITTLLLCSIVSTATQAFSPDLIRGCKTIAEERRNTTGTDAVHAAYCLGVIDGIMAATLKRQSANPLPDPCFDKPSIKPNELAQQVVSILSERPEIIELARHSANDRGAMATYLALAISYKCDKP